MRYEHEPTCGYCRHLGVYNGPVFVCRRGFFARILVIEDGNGEEAKAVLFMTAKVLSVF